MKIINKVELNKLNTSKPRAFEMTKFENGEFVCVAYITTAKQWKEFLSQYKGDKMWVSSVDTKNNVAMLVIE